MILAVSFLVSHGNCQFASHLVLIFLGWSQVASSHTDYTFSMETLGTSWAELWEGRNRGEIEHNMGPSTAGKERGSSS